jgi:hypothetical protein
MYYPEKIEEISYEPEHITKVVSEIESNFHKYFDDYVVSENGNLSDELDISSLAEKFKISTKAKKKEVNKKDNLSRIIGEAINHFEKDRNKYIDLLDIETLEEYETDASYFKDTILRNQCPIIQHTLQNKKAKELDKYRYEFNASDPTELLETIKNITIFSDKYKNEIAQSIDFNKIEYVDDLHISELEEEDYIVFGVIGGGIKSHFLFKKHPDLFAYRSREAVWSLWYLTSKKKFGCKQDSEFLMINLKDNTTQQNYFYPYDLFSFYAVQILKLLKTEYSKIGVNFDEKYRFVIVDSFLSFIAQKHISEIKELKKKLKEDGYF